MDDPMKRTLPADAERTRRFITLSFTLVGLSYALSGVLLLLAPEFFLENIGRFPPFNRHYMGDAGAFVLAVGVGLLVVRKAPWEHGTVVLVGLVATQVHFLNHLYDAVFHDPDLVQWLTDAVPNMILSGIYLMAYFRIRTLRMVVK